ncbi:hypothetical protein [Streptomyces alanosinicus]|uniref:SH3 domain-containing protein n=1 Tax=Streptomyces alanosinicus TaxID=68171 RepID=A0A918YN33_9ACTN|nr:hypothetical protein [Streptomyces alanosinicus]GHE09098.1 hypothetical protein GCM10010339_60330 [Streptomyces alanosinicus]
MRRKFAGVAVAAIAIVGIGTAGAPAVAAPASGVRATIDCPASWPAKAKESVKIRTAPRTSATAVGLFPKGATGCYIASKLSEKYTACGRTSTEWELISYGSKHGWIMHTCDRTYYP